MAYKISGFERIEDDRDVVVKNLNATTIRRLYSGLGSGTSNGYASGGYAHPPYVGYSKVEKFPFASATTNASNVGNLLTQHRYSAAGSISPTHCYNAGGSDGLSNSVATIDKFPSSADANATDVGDLTQGRTSIGSTDRNGGKGYAAGGIHVPGPVLASNVIDKFPFSADNDATDVGDLTVIRGYLGGAGISSQTHGYVSGGYNPQAEPSVPSNVIDKFSFTTDGNATDVGDLTQARYSMDRTSSTTHGYSGGGYIYPAGTYPNILDKFPFASDANATDVGDMTVYKSARAGISSETHGYAAGGSPGVNTIDRYPFSVDANAVDVGDLSTPTVNATGNQG